MTKLGDVYGSHVKHADLQGKEVTVVISEIEPREFDDGKQKLVMGFQGRNKTFVCNWTNANFLAEAFGTDETDDWIGRAIVLYGTRVPFGSKMVDAIRVKVPEQAAPAQPQQPPPHTEADIPPDADWDAGDEIPF